MLFFNQLRGKEEPKALDRLVLDSVLILLLGIGLGIFSKFLDCTAVNELPYFLEYLDVRNFLGRFAIWMLLGVWIAVCSNSAARASVNVFLFFFGMVASYYLYTFFPGSYAVIWFGITALSPLPAVLCWYAKGKGKISFALSVGILAVLFQATTVVGWLYFEVRSVLELVVFLLGILILRRDTVKGTVMLAALGIGLGLLLGLLL